ncbi:MAG: substrate-binding domain-containing protein [Anaerolineae bacterium]|nr:substrate-binding domain-containing protein [Anaerolineae bacterium]
MPTLGLITNNQHEVFQRTVIAGVQAVAEARGYGLIIDSYAEDEANPRPISLDYQAVDGVLVLASAAPPDLLREIYTAHIPLSLVSHQTPDLPVPAVITDNQQGVGELVKHLVVNCARKNLVFIQGLPGQRDSDERQRAFTHEVMRYNLIVPSKHILRGDFSAFIAAQSVQQLIDTGAIFDAIIASDYLMGIAAVETLREAGIAVPEDVAVVAFGDGSEAETAGLTTVAADVMEQGKRAARQLISQIEGLRIRGVTILSVRLVVRETSLIDPV